MATTTMTTVNNILKEVYEKQLRDQLQSEIITTRRIEKTSEGVSHDVGGKYTVFPVRVKRNHGIGARQEMEALPTPRTQGYEAARVNLKYLYGAIEVSGQVFELAERDPQAFASAMQEELNGIKEGLRKDYNRQIYGTNRGTLETATAAGTTTTFVTTNNAQYLEIGMIVDIYDSANALQDAAREITAIVEAAGTTTVTFTPAAAGATSSGDYLVRAGSNNREITGFKQIVDNTGFPTLYNINHAVWTAEVDATAGALSEARMINMVDRIRKRGGRTTVIFTSLGVRRAYFNLLVQQRRYTGTTEFTGGFSGLAFTTDWGDVPVVADYDCQPSTAYFLNEKELKLYQENDWSFMNRDGSNWQRVITASGDFDAYTARLFKYCELGTHRRNSQGVLQNVTEA